MSTMCSTNPLLYRRSLASDASSLSSGTIAGMLRNDALEYGYRCAELWVIDQYQSRFVWFCRNCDPDAKTWQDAWRLFSANIKRVRRGWTCGYQGETDYRVSNVRYSVRHQADPRHPWNGDYFETGVMLHLGAIWSHGGGNLDGVHHFPPNDIIAAFPGYVPLGATYDWVDDGSRYKSIANWTYIYHDDFGKPEPHIVRNWPNGSLRDYCTPMANVDHDRFDWELDIKPFRHLRA